MKKIISIVFICMVLIVNVFSYEFEIVKTFPFYEPFGYNPNWDKVEGTKEGPSYIRFDENRIIISDNTKPWFHRFFSYEYEEIGRVEIKNGSRSINPCNGIALIKEMNKYEIYSRINNYPDNITGIITVGVDADSKNISNDYSYFMTENYLFAQTWDKNLVSWELLGEGKYTYRNIKETKKWLESGIGEHIGYHLDPSKYNGFGDFRISSSGLYMGYIWRDLIFPEGEYKNLKNLKDFEYIGEDKKGLSYYWGAGPLPIDYGKIFKDPNFQVVIAIVDTWTRKVAFRMLDPGEWTPPYDKDRSLIGIFPKAIHPNGDVYFFDADEEKKEYELKRLKNDWWKEMGVDTRKIARIFSNHIPLRTSQSVASEANGYNYANEYVWIQEEGNPAVDGNGKETRWLRIQKIDGKAGWIHESEVYWEE